MKYSLAFVLFFSAAVVMAEPAKVAAPLPAVDHILLEVKDLDRSIKFYRDFMGLQFEKKSGDFVTMKAANVGVFLWSDRWKWSPKPGAGGRAPQGMYSHLVYTDVKGVVGRLQKAGYKIVQDAKTYSYGTEAFVADPDGFVWALITPQK